MRGARLGGPAAHVQKSQKSLGLRPRSVSHEPHTTDLTRTEYVVRHGFQERHELVAGLAGRRDGLDGRRGDLAGPAGEEEAAAATTMVWTGLRSSAATCRLERGHRYTPET